MRLIDIAGQRFGKLLVIERAEKLPGVWWKCQCDCGTIKEVKASKLKEGTKSCGCLRFEKASDLTGQRFYRLTAISRAENRGVGDESKAMWNCTCDCGKEITAFAYALRSGNTKSCGCLKIETSTNSGRLKRTHGMTKTPAWICWSSMRQRCENPNHKNYKDYGGRGITVCEAWKSFEQFHSDMGDPPPDMTLDRRDVNGNYEPSNCRWATLTEQGRNRRNNRIIEVNGVYRTLAEWAQITGISRRTISDRIRLGWTTEQSVTIQPFRWLK